MSIKLRFEKGSRITQVVLKDDAIGELDQLINKYESDDVPLSPLVKAVSSPFPPNSPNDTAAPVKEWMASHSASEVLNLLKWETYPEKILLMGAFHESSGGNEGWRSADMETRFSEARDKFPKNFPRDISSAIKDNLIAPVTARSYKVGRIGWNKIADAITKLDIN